MNELIPIASTVIGGQAVQTCDARELHAFLEVGRDFSNWIKDRVAKYGFVEGVDYVRLAKNGERGNQWVSGGQDRVDYALTLRMAEHLGMAENNPQGVLIRDYIAIEFDSLNLANQNLGRASRFPSISADSERNPLAQRGILGCTVFAKIGGNLDMP